MRDLLEELSQEIWGETDYSVVFTDIAEAKYNSGNYEHALIASQQSLNINPNGYYPLYLQGKIYSFKEDYPLSIYYFSKALKVKKTFYLFLQRGISKYELKNYEDAINDFKESISLNPEYTPCYYFIADCKYELKNYAGAVLDLNSAIELADKQNKNGKYFNRMDEFFADSGDDLLYGLRGQCKYEMDYYKDAIEDFNKAIKINPTNDLYLFHRAECKYELKDDKGALDDLNKLLKIYPSYLGFSFRGDVKINLEDHEGAIEDFNKAIEINSDNKKSIEFKKQCIQKLDNISDAFIKSISLKLSD